MSTDPAAVPWASSWGGCGCHLGKKLGYAGVFGSICAAITTAIVAKASVANNRGKCVYARYYISLGAPAPVFVKPNYVVGEYKDSRCK